MDCQNCHSKITAGYIICQGCQITMYCPKDCLKKHEIRHKTFCDEQRNLIIEGYCKAAALIKNYFPSSKVSKRKGE